LNAAKTSVHDLTCTNYDFNALTPSCVEAVCAFLVQSAMAVQLNIDKETEERPELWLNDLILHHDSVPAH
jgi:hypothetical protein